LYLAHGSWSIAASLLCCYREPDTALPLAGHDCRLCPQQAQSADRRRVEEGKVMETMAVVCIICLVCAYITVICKRQRMVLWQFLGVAFVAYATLAMTRSIAGLLALPLAPPWVMILTAVIATGAMFYITPATPAPVTQGESFRMQE
jgi:hypothetical protein